MPDTPEVVENTFREILVAARRAEQLIGGARPRLSGRFVKPTTVALEELRCGLVPWRPVTAEEYELLRQEEATAREKEEQAPAILAAPRPAVPVFEEPELVEEEELEDLDEELQGPDFEADDLAEVDVDASVTEDLLGPEE